ncbi:1812_t:CDS:1, partial [Dentiscutata erythropus]
AFNTLTSSYRDLYNYAILHNQWATLKKIAKFLELFKDFTIKISSGTN